MDLVETLPFMIVICAISAVVMALWFGAEAEQERIAMNCDELLNYIQEHNSQYGYYANDWIKKECWK